MWVFRLRSPSKLILGDRGKDNSMAIGMRLKPGQRDLMVELLRGASERLENADVLRGDDEDRVTILHRDQLVVEAAAETTKDDC